MHDSPVVSSTVPALLDVLKQVPDFRSRHGRRYPLEAILALGIAAVLCGYNTYGAMADWGKNYGAELATALGFRTGRTPSVGTLFTVFSKIDKAALHGVLFAWNEQVLTALELPTEPQIKEPQIRATSVDGKALRGSAKQQALDPHILSAVRHGLGLTRGQEAVSAKENEIPAMKRLLDHLVIKGQVLTMDALLTQKEIARKIVGKGGST
jgi:hypothetical protein